MTNTEENTADSLVVDPDFGGETITKAEAAAAETEDLARALLAVREPSTDEQERSKHLYEKALESLAKADQAAVVPTDHVQIALAYQQLVYAFGTPRF